MYHSTLGDLIAPNIENIYQENTMFPSIRSFIWYTLSFFPPYSPKPVKTQAATAPTKPKKSKHAPKTDRNTSNYHNHRGHTSSKKF